MVQNLRSRLSQAAAYPGLGVYTRINSSFRVLCTLAAAYFLLYKRPLYCKVKMRCTMVFVKRKALERKDRSPYATADNKTCQ